jgi:transposase-like protein
MQNSVPPMEARSRFVLATPTCPICKTGMRVVQVTPIIFSRDLDEATYVCDECGQSTKRTLKRI